MKTRTPALSTQLNSALTKVELLTAERDNLIHLRGEVAALTKKLADAEQTKNYYKEQNSGFNKELNEIHSFLDAIPNPPTKTHSDGYTTFSAMTRLSVWLANRP